MKQRLMTVANAVAVFAALLLIWQLVLWVFHVPPYMLPSPLRCARGHVRVFLRFSLRWYYRGRIRGRTARQHFCRRLDRADFRAIALGAANALSLYAAVADRAHRRHRAADPDVGRRGTAAVAFIAFIISLAPIIANTTQGLISVDENLVHLFLMHNASPCRFFSSCACRMPCPRSSWGFASPAALR